MKIPKTLIVILLAFVLFVTTINDANAQQETEKPVVYAVLYYSPTCGHCEYVINTVLPPLMEQYGDQLQIIGINISLEVGNNLYNEAHEIYQVPEDRYGVPLLVIGDTYLVGSQEVPDQLPGIIEQGLKNGGIPLPELPLLIQLMAESKKESATPSEATEESSSQIQPTASLAQPTDVTADEALAEKLAVEFEEAMEAHDKLSPFQKFALYPIANSLSLIILVGMVVSVILVGYAYWSNLLNLKTWPTWAIPLLMLIGTMVAIYLSYIETANQSAVCGPVGDCNTVQQSEYARLFGILPIGVLGLIGYIGLTIIWLISWKVPSQERIAHIAFWVTALLGTLFSIYLTFLEPFVIGASCLWCLTSAVVMTLLLWGSTPNAIKSKQGTL